MNANTPIEFPRRGSEAALDALEVFEATPLDATTIRQDLLDLANRQRTNPFPWRGQFSPQLIELLLTHDVCGDCVVLDPFAGVGTTLFEAARKGLPCVGTEINPAAVTMAGTAAFSALPVFERRDLCRRARSLIKRTITPASSLFAQDATHTDLPRAIASLALEQNCQYLESILANVLIRVLERPAAPTLSAALEACDQHERIILELPLAKNRCEMLHVDARYVPEPSGSFHLIITSPPYINVFNYHQNGRVAMELLGWDLLRVAASEFGSNRKHRGNRLLTVIQYCLDMTEALVEMRRLLAADGRAILVLGRESQVRGISFQNSRIVAALAAASGFKLQRRQERKFTNKFGARIFEDILHLSPAPKGPDGGFGIARSIARHLLMEAADKPTEASEDIADAIERIGDIQPSPKLDAKVSRRG